MRVSGHGAANRLPLRLRGGTTRRGGADELEASDHDRDEHEQRRRGSGQGPGHVGLAQLRAIQGMVTDVFRTGLRLASAELGSGNVSSIYLRHETQPLPHTFTTRRYLLGEEQGCGDAVRGGLEKFTRAHLHLYVSGSALAQARRPGDRAGERVEAHPKREQVALNLKRDQLAVGVVALGASADEPCAERDRLVGLPELRFGEPLRGELGRRRASGTRRFGRRSQPDDLFAEANLGGGVAHAGRILRSGYIGEYRRLEARATGRGAVHGGGRRRRKCEPDRAGQEENSCDHFHLRRPIGGTWLSGY